VTEHGREERVEKGMERENEVSEEKSQLWRNGDRWRNKISLWSEKFSVTLYAECSIPVIRGEYPGPGGV
jgi:hypothetical protein